MKYIPHDYQEVAKSHMLAKPKSLLLLDMGLGKTSIALTALEELMFNRLKVEKTLIIAPAKVINLETWPSELNKWKHLKGIDYVNLNVSPAKRKELLEEHHHIYLLSHQMVGWLIDYYGHRWDFDCLIIDELSAFKNPSSIRFKKLRKVTAKTPYVYGLTGTPIPNGYPDLWSQIYLFDQGARLGKNITSYRNTFLMPDKRNGQTIFTYKLQEGAKARIDTAVQDICLSMMAKDHLKMPERIDNYIEIPLDAKTQKLYDTLAKDFILEYEESEITAGSAGVLIGKLLQLAGGGIYNEDGNALKIGEAKLDALENIVDTTDKPLLVMYNFKHEKEAIFERFKNLKPQELKKPEDIDKWNRGETAMIVAHPASIGYGLNIQEGSSIIVWYGLTWALELYQQTNARLFRQGQKDTVIIHHLVAKGTVDEQVIRSLSNKGMTQSDMIEALKRKNYE